METGRSLDTPRRWQGYETEAEWWLAEYARRTQRLQALSQSSEARRIERERCRRSWHHWITQWGWVFAAKETEAARRETPFVLWESQAEAAEWLETRRELAETACIPKAREIGISWLCLHLILWHFLFEPGYTALLGSRKEEIVDKQGDPSSLFEKLRRVLRKQPKWMLPKGEIRSVYMMLECPETGSSIKGESTNAAFGQSGRVDTIFIDEAARIDHRLLQSIWIAIESVARTIWMVWNPGDEDHKTYHLHHGDEALPPRMIREMDWTADPRRPPDFVEQQIKPRGRLTRAEAESAYCLKYGYVQQGLIWAIDPPAVRYAEESKTWKKAIEDGARKEWQIMAGWDFGSGASLLCCVFGHCDMRDPSAPVLWVDGELVWSGTKWQTAAQDVFTFSRREGYEARQRHVGDPAGANRESDQMSWERNLQGAGIPIVCLAPEYNTRESLEWSYKQVQHLADSGRLKIHERCRYLWKVMTGWRRDLPEGQSLDYVSRAYVPPRKDRLSHGGQALAYLVAAFVRWADSIGPGGEMEERPEEAKSIDEILDSVVRGLGDS